MCILQHSPKNPFVQEWKDREKGISRYEKDVRKLPLGTTGPELCFSTFQAPTNHLRTL